MNWKATIAAAGFTALTLGPPASLGAQAPFEGKAVYRVTAETGQTGTVTWLVKGKKLRQDLALEGTPPEMQAAYVVVDAAGGTMNSVIPSQRAYVRVNLKQMRERMAAKDTATGAARVSKTGQTDRFAGYACEHYLIGKRQDVDMCLAKGIGILAPVAAADGGMGGLMGGPANEGSDAYAELFRQGLFPLQVSRITGTERRVLMEALSVERMRVPASSFAIPAGYRPMRMPAPRPYD